MNTDILLSPTLQRVHELREEGKSLRRIAEILEAERVPLPPGRYKKWNQMGVRACLQQLEALTAPPAPSPAAGVGAGDPPSPSSPSDPAPPPSLPRLNVKVQGPWIATDHLLWEFLLHKVWVDLPEKTAGILYHTIPLPEALKGLQLPRRRRDREHLRDALERLAASRVTLDGARNPELLSLSTSLISAWVTEDSLSFQFPVPVIKLVKNPQQYIRLKKLLGAKQ